MAEPAAMNCASIQLEELPTSGRRYALRVALRIGDLVVAETIDDIEDRYLCQQGKNPPLMIEYEAIVD